MFTPRIDINDNKDIYLWYDWGSKRKFLKL